MIGASQETFSQNKSYQKQSNFPNDKSWIFDKDKGATTNNNEIEHTKMHFYLILGVFNML